MDGDSGLPAVDAIHRIRPALRCNSGRRAARAGPRGSARGDEARPAMRTNPTASLQQQKSCGSQPSRREKGSGPSPRSLGHFRLPAEPVLVGWCQPNTWLQATLSLDLPGLSVSHAPRNAPRLTRYVRRSRRRAHPLASSARSVGRRSKRAGRRSRRATLKPRHATAERVRTERRCQRTTDGKCGDAASPHLRPRQLATTRRALAPIPHLGQARLSL